MSTEGLATEDDTVVHNGKLVWKTGAAINHPGGRDSGRPRILFQLVPEPKTVKNRLHLDLRPVSDDPEADRRRLVARGATESAAVSEGPVHEVGGAHRPGRQRVLRAD